VKFAKRKSGVHSLDDVSFGAPWHLADLRGARFVMTSENEKNTWTCGRLSINECQPGGTPTMEFAGGHLFHKKPEDMRGVGALGGRTRARNLRLHKAREVPVTREISRPREETAGEAMV
jgi:hypothetical protein